MATGTLYKHFIFISFFVSFFCFGQHVVWGQDVKKGDLIYFCREEESLADIVRMFTGDTASLETIRKYNHSGLSQELKTGQRILIPNAFLLSQYRLQADSASPEDQPSNTGATSYSDSNIGLNLLASVDRYQQLLGQEKNGADVENEIANVLEQIISAIETIDKVRYFLVETGIDAEFIERIKSRKAFFQKAFFLRGGRTIR